MALQGYVMKLCARSFHGIHQRRWRHLQVKGSSVPSDTQLVYSRLKYDQFFDSLPNFSTAA